MNRVLAVSIGLSAGLHAAILCGLPESMSLRNLGLGGSMSDAPERHVRYLPTVRIAFQEPVPDETREAPRPPTSPDGATAEDPDASGQGEPSGTDQPPIQLPADLDPPATETPLPLPPGELALPVLPALHRPTAAPIRIEDVIWNRKVAERIGRPFLPAVLKNQDLHGTVRLLLLLTPEGKVRDLRVTDAGASDTLAMAAQAQVRASAPFPPAPAGMDPCFLRIPVILRYGTRNPLAPPGAAP